MQCMSMASKYFLASYGHVCVCARVCEWVDAVHVDGFEVLSGVLWACVCVCARAWVDAVHDDGFEVLLGALWARARARVCVRGETKDSERQRETERQKRRDAFTHQCAHAHTDKKTDRDVYTQTKKTRTYKPPAQPTLALLVPRSLST